MVNIITQKLHFLIVITFENKGNNIIIYQQLQIYDIIYY